jgi:hypothetical protein
MKESSGANSSIQKSKLSWRVRTGRLVDFINNTNHKIHWFSGF